MSGCDLTFSFANFLASRTQLIITQAMRAIDLSADRLTASHSVPVGQQFPCSGFLFCQQLPVQFVGSIKR
jgi:hypothetical protein